MKTTRIELMKMIIRAIKVNQKKRETNRKEPQIYLTTLKVLKTHNKTEAFAKQRWYRFLVDYFNSQTPSLFAT